MKKALRLLLLTFGVLFCLAMASILSAGIYGNPPRSSTLMIADTVKYISAHEDTKDIGFRLAADDSNRYYINRALEQGLTENGLIELTRNKPVIIYYYNRGWNILDPRHRMRHICELKQGEKVIFSELRD